MSISTAGNEQEIPRYRSGAAARLAKMPVATLRIWERRYSVVAPMRSATGRRIYSARDVQRLVLVKTLVEQGHAIGAIASLDQAQLESLARSQPQPRVAVETTRAASNAHMIIVGATFRARLLGQGINLDNTTTFADLEAANQAAIRPPVGALLVHVPSLQPEMVQQILALANRCGAGTVVVLYAFGTNAAADTLRIAGATLFREPVNSTDIVSILHDIENGHLARDVASNAQLWGRAERRYSDQTLSAIAQRSTTIACECPRHLAELIMQISGFEQYTDGCASRTTADAVLHRYLGDISSRARALFEVALERVAKQEGWHPDDGASKQNIVGN